MGQQHPIFTPLDGPEYKTAIAAIEKAGLDPTLFALEQRCDNPLMLGAMAAPRKLISVKHLMNGTQRQYSSGRGGGWPYEFERDLRLFFYGRPEAAKFPRNPGAGAGVRST